MLVATYIADIILSTYARGCITVLQKILSYLTTTCELRFHTEPQSKELKQLTIYISSKSFQYYLKHNVSSQFLKISGGGGFNNINTRMPDITSNILIILVVEFK